MKKIIFGICLLFISGYMFAQYGSSTKNINPNAPIITFDKVIHNFGTMEYKSDKGHCVFKFKNTGREPLILSRPRSSCGCAVPTWPKQPILPGQSGQISVKFDTKRVGKIRKTITIRSNARNKSIVLKLKGLVKPKTTKK